MTLRRGIVQGWDSGSSQPKGVAGAIDVRQSVSSLAVRAGVFRTSATACAASGTGTMAVQIQPFRAAIESSLGGFYIVTEDDVASVTLDAADSSNKRKDIIGIRQNDYQADAGKVDSTVEYVYIKGTAGVSPVAPSIPAGVLGLWEIELPASAASTNAVGVVMTPVFKWTVPAGASVPVRTVADLANAPAIPNLHAHVFATPGADYERIGTAWRATHGVLLVPNQTARDALVTDGLAYESMFVLQVDTGVTYVRRSSAWKIWDYPPTTFTPAVTGISQGATGTLTGLKMATSGMAHVYYGLLFGGSGMAYSTNDETRGFDLPSDMPVNSDLTSMNRHLSGSAMFTDASAATTGAERRIELAAMVSVDNSLAASRLTVFRKNAPATNDTIQMSRTTTGIPTPAAGDTVSAEVHYPL